MPPKLSSQVGRSRGAAANKRRNKGVAGNSATVDLTEDSNICEAKKIYSNQIISAETEGWPRYSDGDVHIVLNQNFMYTLSSKTLIESSAWFRNKLQEDMQPEDPAGKTAEKKFRKENPGIEAVFQLLPISNQQHLVRVPLVFCMPILPNASSHSKVSAIFQQSQQASREATEEQSAGDTKRQRLDDSYVTRGSVQAAFHAEITAKSVSKPPSSEAVVESEKEEDITTTQLPAIEACGRGTKRKSPEKSQYWSQHSESQTQSDDQRFKPPNAMIDMVDVDDEENEIPSVSRERDQFSGSKAGAREGFSSNMIHPVAAPPGEDAETIVSPDPPKTTASSKSSEPRENLDYTRSSHLNAWPEPPGGFLPIEARNHYGYKVHGIHEASASVLSATTHQPQGDNASPLEEVNMTTDTILSEFSSSRVVTPTYQHENNGIGPPEVAETFKSDVDQVLQQSPTSPAPFVDDEDPIDLINEDENQIVDNGVSSALDTSSDSSEQQSALHNMSPQPMEAHYEHSSIYDVADLEIPPFKASGCQFGGDGGHDVEEDMDELSRVPKDGFQTRPATTEQAIRKTGSRRPQPLTSAAAFIRAFDDMLRCIFRQEVDFQFDNLDEFYSRSRRLLSRAKVHGCLKLVRPVILVALLEYDRELWVAILADPPKWLLLGYLLQSRLIFNDAIIHIIGQSPSWPWPTTQKTVDSACPVVIADLIKSKTKDLEQAKTKLFQDLVTVTICIGERSVELTSSSPRSSSSFLVGSVWRQWIVVNLLNHQDHPEKLGDFYRTIMTGGDGYLPFAKLKDTLQTMEFKGSDEWAEAEGDLKLLKCRASDIVRMSGLCLSFTKLDVAEFRIGYLTCVDCEHIEMPWIYEQK